MKIDRLLAIVLLLFKRKKMTAAELADYFNVSVRTIYRDIETIDTAGIPIVSVQGSGGGYEILDSYKLERQLFNSEDMKQMLATLKGMEPALGDSRSHTVAKKLETLMPKETNVFDEMKMEFSPWGDSNHKSKVLKILQGAVHQKQVVRFLYLNTKRESLERTVEPLTLVFKGFSWYLYAFCQARNDYRLFKLSRIRNCVVQPSRFVRKEKSFDEFKNETEQNTIKDVIELTLLFEKTARFMVEDYFLPNQIKPHKDGTFLVTISIPDGDWLYHLLFSFGSEVEVVAPKRIRHRFLKHAQKMVKKHSDKTLQ